MKFLQPNTNCSSEPSVSRIGTRYPVSHGRIFFYLLGVLFFSRAFSQVADPVGAKAVQSILEVRQGNVLSTAILVTNPSTVRKTYNVRLVLPEGWRPVLRDTRFDLAPGQSDTRL